MSSSNYTLETDLTKFQSLKNQILTCRHCQPTFGFEPHPIVFGSPHAKIMQIRQAPSLTVHKTGKPFNDASGRRLRSEWYKIPDKTFYNPDNFYIVSIAHCYRERTWKAVTGDRQNIVLTNGSSRNLNWYKIKFTF